MSFFDAFIGGAAEQGAAYASDSIKNDELLERQKQLAQFNADLEEKKAKTKMTLEAEFSDAARTKQVGIVNSAINKNADASVASKYADPVMGDTPLSDDQQAVLNSGMERNVADRQADKAKFANDPMNRLKAEVESGYKGDTSVVTADLKEQTLANQSAALEGKAAHLKEQEKNATDRTAIYEHLADLKSKLNANGLTAEDRKQYTTLLTESRRSIKDLNDTLNKAQENKPHDPMAIADWKDGIQSLKDRIKDEQKDHDMFRSQLANIGNPKLVQDSPAKNAGSSGGKAPYPDGTVLSNGGKKFIVRNGVPVPL